MPLYDYECEKGHRFEAFQHQYVDKIECRGANCVLKAKMILVAVRGSRWDPNMNEPIAIHRAPDGRVRFPGRFDAPAPPGYERVELKTTAEKRAFQKTMDRSERVKWEESQARQIAFFDQRRKELRSQTAFLVPDQDADGTVHRNADGSVRMVTVRLQDLSPRARGMLAAARQIADRRQNKNFDAGFHMEHLEMDASNREPYCDEATGWRGRK